MELGWWYPWGIVLWRLTNRVGWDSRFWNCAPFLGEVDGSESHIYRGGVCWQEIHQLNLVPDSCSCEVIWKIHRLVILWSWNEMCPGTKAVLSSKIAGIPTARASLRMHQTQKWQPTAGSRTCLVDLCYRKCILQRADSPTLVSDISKWSVVVSVKLPLLKVSEHTRNGSIFGQLVLWPQRLDFRKRILEILIKMPLNLRPLNSVVVLVGCLRVPRCWEAIGVNDNYFLLLTNWCFILFQANQLRLHP